MKIAIIGLGYVGAVTGSTLADMGHSVTVVDRDLAKVEMLREARSPIPEPGLQDLVARGVASGHLTASESVIEAGKSNDLVIVSVGTPTDHLTGDPDLSAVERVSADLAKAIENRENDRLRVAISSTVPPGTTEGLVRPILEAQGANAGRFALCFLPEFLREGTAIEDFRHPSRFVIGARSEEEAAEFSELRSDIPDRHFLVETSVAEMQKSAENCWHATKVTFANEIARIAEAHGVNPHLVMDLLLADNKQNVSAAYMRPGFAYGGSCLPKDLRSVVRLAQSRGVSAPMLSGVAASNRDHIDSAVAAIERIGLARVGVLGLAFKEGTDDLRESPSVALIEALVGKGFLVSVHDYEALRHPVFGTNQEEWDRHAHLRGRMTSTPEELIHESDVVVVAQFNRRYAELLGTVPEGAPVIDLSGLSRQPWAQAHPVGLSNG